MSLKNKPVAFMTLDQFRELAARFQAKIDYIKYKLSQYKECEDNLKPVVVDDVLALLDKPADSFFSHQDMSVPLAPHCYQLDFFGRELC